MKIAQTTKILNLLDDSDWHCTSQMYAMFISDPRRRLCDLKDKGYKLESRSCKSHNYHDGGSKEWRLIAEPAFSLIQQTMESIN